MPRLTDKQRKRMVSDYIELGSYSAVAKKYGVAVTTVKRAVEYDNRTLKIAKQKKEANTNDILAHMDSKKDTVNEIIDKALDALNDQQKLAKTSPMQIATMLGIVIDKFTGTRHVVEKLRADAAKNSVETKEAVEDDPITNALKEEKENGLI